MHMLPMALALSRAFLLFVLRSFLSTLDLSCLTRTWTLLMTTPDPARCTVPKRGVGGLGPLDGPGRFENAGGAACSVVGCVLLPGHV